MSLIKQILLQSGVILGFVLIALAFVISGIVLFKPALAARMSSYFNNWTSTQHIHDSVDTHVHTTDYILRYRWLFGGLFLAGAAYSAKFLLLDFEEKTFIALVVSGQSSNIKLATEIGVAVTRWTLLVFSAVGFFTCLMILFKPELFISINEKLDKVFCTKKIGHAVDSYHSIDEWVLKNNILIGGFMFLASCFLLVYFVSFLR